MTRRVLGIDPDANGAIACIASGYWTIAPLDIAHSTDALACITASDVVALETIPYIPGKGGRSLATQNRRWGAIRERLRAIGCEVVEVDPRRWQAALGLSAKRGESTRSHKLRIHIAAERLCGSSLPAGHGDGVCLAWWGLERSAKADLSAVA